jgi:DNA-binding NarL/FixJ family response regulator
MCLQGDPGYTESVTASAESVAGLHDRRGARPGVVVGVLGQCVADDLTRALVSAGYVVLATELASDAVELLPAAEPPQVLLVGDVIDYALLARLKAKAPATGIVVVSHRPACLSGTALLAAGASCVDGEISAADLIAAIELVARGTLLYHSASGQRIERPAVTATAELTRRELEVFRHLSAGRSYAETALKLSIGYETVRTHARRICKKLDVPGRQELSEMEMPSVLCGN